MSILPEDLPSDFRLPPVPANIPKHGPRYRSWVISQMHAARRVEENRHAEYEREGPTLDNVADREAARQRKHERRTLLSCTEKTYTVQEWLALCEKYDNRCACCGALSPLTVDHVIPVVKGGRNSIDNLQPLCAPCNSAKGTKTTDYRKP